MDARFWPWEEGEGEGSRDPPAFGDGAETQQPEPGLLPTRRLDASARAPEGKHRRGVPKVGVRVAKGSRGGSREYSNRLIPRAGLRRREPGGVRGGSKLSTPREAAGDAPQTRGIPPKWLQDAPASPGRPRGLHPPPPPPRGGNLKAQNQATVSRGRGVGGVGWWRTSRRGDPARPAGAETRRVPRGGVGEGWGGDSRESRAGHGPGWGGARARRSSRRTAPPPQPRRPRPGGGAPREGLPVVSPRAVPHRTPHTRPAGAARAEPSRALPSRAPPPRPGPARAAARRTLHSPEFLHVCGRGLRETKREGQQAGGVRPAAAPGGAGHSGHRAGAAAGRPAPLARRQSPARAPPAPVPGPRDSGEGGGAPGRGRVTGEPARAAALPATELRPPPGREEGAGPGRSRAGPEKGGPARPR